jgi:hypothetical protein
MPDLPGNENEQGKSVTYRVNAPPGVTNENLVGLTLVNGMNGNKPGWFVHSVEITGFTPAGSDFCIVRMLDLNRWLDTGEHKLPDDGPARPLLMRTPIRHTKDCGE